VQAPPATMQATVEQSSCPFIPGQVRGKKLVHISCYLGVSQIATLLSMWVVRYKLLSRCKLVHISCYLGVSQIATLLSMWVAGH
jgi:hypothetical protein